LTFCPKSINICGIDNSSIASPTCVRANARLRLLLLLLAVVVRAVRAVTLVKSMAIMATDKMAILIISIIEYVIEYHAAIIEVKYVIAKYISNSLL